MGRSYVKGLFVSRGMSDVGWEGLEGKEEDGGGDEEGTEVLCMRAVQGSLLGDGMWTLDVGRVSWFVKVKVVAHGRGGGGDIGFRGSERIYV